MISCPLCFLIPISGILFPMWDSLTKSLIFFYFSLLFCSLSFNLISGSFIFVLLFTQVFFSSFVFFFFLKTVSYSTVMALIASQTRKPKSWDPTEKEFRGGWAKFWSRRECLPLCVTDTMTFCNICYCFITDIIISSDGCCWSFDQTPSWPGAPIPHAALGVAVRVPAAPFSVELPLDRWHGCCFALRLLAPFPQGQCVTKTDWYRNTWGGSPCLKAGPALVQFTPQVPCEVRLKMLSSWDHILP